MYKLAIISPEKIEKGFSLTGAGTHVSDIGTKTQEILASLLEETGLGVVIIPQEHLADFDPRFLKKLDEVQLPLVVPIPMGGKEKADAEAYVSQIVRRAIGYQIKI